MKKVTIGVFDSGVGGLWILKQLERTLPRYSYIYYADQAHIPYGSKTNEEIIAFSKEIVTFLLSKCCDVIVIACNSATSAAIDTLRKEFAVPFVGIEPAIKPASLQSKTKHIGVLATKVTTEGQRLQDSIEHFATDVDVHVHTGYGLVELIEEGKANTDEAESLLRIYLEPMIKKNIDQLVLGCTHYAFLIKSIQEIVGDRVAIIDPAQAVVKRVRHILEENNLMPNSNTTKPELYTSGDNVEKLNEIYKNL